MKMYKNIIKEIEVYRKEVLDYLKQNSLRFNLEKTNHKISNYDINYYKWKHPNQEDFFTHPNQEWVLKNIEGIKSLIRPNSNVLDIGAQVGNLSVVFSLFANKVISFEPNPASYEVLEENSKLNPNITSYNLACSIKEEPITFHYSDPGLCNGGFAEALNAGVGVTGHSFPLDVYGVNVTEFLKDSHPDFINNIGLIKIDAEGHDKEIIPTLKEILDLNKPILITEVYAGLNFEEMNELIKSINNIDYIAYNEINYYSLYDKNKPVLSYKDIILQEGTTNLICFPKNI
jgi:FkbM family methyltransferase